MSVSAKEIYNLSEDEYQQTVVEYCDACKIPVVHIANEGKRSVAYAARLKRIGMRKGFPDLFIPIASGGHHGLFIELKSMTGRLTPAQKWWLAELNHEGYRAVMCRGSDEAIDVIRKYMKERNRDEHNIR